MKSSFRAISGFIQAGGHSSRMGTDKSWIKIEDIFMIQRVINAALPCVDPCVEKMSVVINSTNPNINSYKQLSSDNDLRLIYDIHDHKGPLGGIHTVLKQLSSASSALILACDLPFISEQFIRFLIDTHLSEDNALTLPEDIEGRLQPLAGIYSYECLSHVDQMMAGNILRVDKLCERVKTRNVRFDEYKHLEGADKFLVNVNSLLDI